MPSTTVLKAQYKWHNSIFFNFGWESKPAYSPPNVRLSVNGVSHHLIESVRNTESKQPLHNSSCTADVVTHFVNWLECHGSDWCGFKAIIQYLIRFACAIADRCERQMVCQRWRWIICLQKLKCGRMSCGDALGISPRFSQPLNCYCAKK